MCLAALRVYFPAAGGVRESERRGAGSGDLGDIIDIFKRIMYFIRVFLDDSSAVYLVNLCGADKVVKADVILCSN